MSWSGFGKVLVVLSAIPWGIALYAIWYMDELGMDWFDPIIYGSLLTAVAMLVIGLLLSRAKDRK